MEYIVIHREGKIAIESSVNELIANGWRPRGGVFVIRGPNPHDKYQIDTEYCQAMIREEAPARTPSIAFATLVAAVMKRGFDFEQALRIVELTKGGE